MKLPILLTACSLFTSVLASPAPLVDVESTSLTLDSSKAALDNGQIVLHLTRLDDLLDDAADYKLLLERVTHVLISIRLDGEDGSLNVNGQRLPLTAAPGEGIQIQTLQAEAYNLPTDMPAAFYEPEQVQSLVSTMSQGIVSVEVSLQTESVPIAAVASQLDEDTVAIMSIDGMSLRKIGVFVKIVEIEGQTLVHSSTAYAPIVQLLVASEMNGEVVKHISTLSVGLDSTQEGAIAGSSPTDTLPQIYGNLPPVLDTEELETAEDGLDKPLEAEEAIQPVWHPHSVKSGEFMDFLRAMFGQPRVSSEETTNGKKRPCRMGSGRKGLALAPPAEGYTQSTSEEGNSNSTTSHRHRFHGHHARKNCFWRQFANGFALVFITIGAFFSGIASSLPGAMVLGLFAGALMFKITRTIVKARRARHAREQLPQYSEDAEEFVEDEKVPTEIIIIEQAPPTYTTSNEVIFDASKEDLNEKH